MSKKVKDMTGHIFGKLTVLKRAGLDNFGAATWQCRCLCRREIIVSGRNLRQNNTLSCGCTRGYSTKPEQIDVTVKRYSGNLMNSIWIHSVLSEEEWVECCNYDEWEIKQNKEAL